MTSSAAELEREAIALRQRLAVASGALRESLAPSRLVEEVKHRIGGAPPGTSTVRRLEGAIRTHPLPSILMGIGTTLLLRSRWDTPPDPTDGATENLYGAFKQQAAERLQGLTAMAVANVGAATDRVLDAAEATLDTSVDKLASYARKRPVAFAFVAVAVGFAAMNGLRRIR